jgi:hypothetical protein
MKTEKTEHRCGKHGIYTPDFEREYDGEICPRIMCLECEAESMDPDPENHPRNVSYFYGNECKVVLQEAHRLSGVWQFDPPVVCPEFSFAEDLSPIVPEGSLTSEEIMARMEDMLPEIEKMAQEGLVANPEDLLILPGKELRVDDKA